MLLRDKAKRRERKEMSVIPIIIGDLPSDGVVVVEVCVFLVETQHFFEGTGGVEGLLVVVWLRGLH